MLTPQRRGSSSPTAKENRHIAYLRKRAWMFGVCIAGMVIYWSATRLLRVFHWAESRVHRHVSCAHLGSLVRGHATDLRFESHL